MGRVTARMLHDLGVKNGPDLPVSFDPVQLAKASILQELERLFKGDYGLWLRSLKRLQAKDAATKFLSPVQSQAVQQLIDELEKRAGENCGNR